MAIKLNDNSWNYPENTVRRDDADLQLEKYYTLKATDGIKLINIRKSNSDKLEEDNGPILEKYKSRTLNGHSFYRAGNYIGTVKLSKNTFIIESRFGNIFLERMLSFATKAYVGDPVFNNQNDEDYLKFILYHLFIQSVKKALFFGLPKSYCINNRKTSTFRGTIDIGQYFLHDLPFNGSFSCKFNERQMDLNIQRTLNRALSIVLANKNLCSNILQEINSLRITLRPDNINRLFSNDIVRRAMCSHALRNPIYKEFKDSLYYASLIIEHKNSNPLGKKNRGKSYQFLLNIAELFEIYIGELLRRNLPDGFFVKVLDECKQNVYDGFFYGRMLKPDILIEKGGRIVVLDVKYKRMSFRRSPNGDVDREDFFQIHTYMSIFGNELIGGGLIYPIEADMANTRLKTDWVGHNGIKFFIDGINLSNNQLTVDILKEEETQFIRRIEALFQIS